MALWRFTRAAICVVALLCAVSHATAQRRPAALSVSCAIPTEASSPAPPSRPRIRPPTQRSPPTAQTMDIRPARLAGRPPTRSRWSLRLRSVKNDGVTVRVNEDVRLDPTLKVGDLYGNRHASAAWRAPPTRRRARSRPSSIAADRDPAAQRPQSDAAAPAGARRSPDTHRAHVGRDVSRRQPVSSSGARGNSTNYVLDGGSNNDHYTNSPNPMPNPDALQEFSVQTNNFSAEYGRQMGAIVNAVMRAGTNNFAGLAFGYLRDAQHEREQLLHAEHRATA